MSSTSEAAADTNQRFLEAVLHSTQHEYAPHGVGLLTRLSNPLRRSIRNTHRHTHTHTDTPTLWSSCSCWLACFSRRTSDCRLATCSLNPGPCGTQIATGGACG